MSHPDLRRMMADEFFVWQATQERLHELVDGVPVLPAKMMTGASRAHDRVVVNVIRELATKLRGGPCRPTTDDLAVRIPSGNVRRPDVTVDCGEGSARDMAVADPRVVVEVLSPSTMTFDRVRKLAEYRTVPSIAHILLIDTEAPRVDLWSREADGSPDGFWRRSTHDGLDATLALPAIGVRLALADLFEGSSFAPPAEGG
ncbi:hypothetical protein A33M_0532 [Rhodovulum sp. PH10]|uniref:Uma2 family endonuclease n=1 Tax=Rhodovulum sp. PH10 TaxID=1187851 RepID=UPI00027C2ACB|nr:Uma2 family endonuclease [Rhodovulum sp. PH10]EJW10074.1 hypothetical protein A33M_0532 [Rhodovulum sp. PH10]